MNETWFPFLCHQRTKAWNCWKNEIPLYTETAFSHGKPKWFQKAVPCKLLHKISYCDICHWLELMENQDRYFSMYSENSNTKWPLLSISHKTITCYEMHQIIQFYFLLITCQDTWTKKTYFGSRYENVRFGWSRPVLTIINPWDIFQTNWDTSFWFNLISKVCKFSHNWCSLQETHCI